MELKFEDDIIIVSDGDKEIFKGTHEEWTEFYDKAHYYFIDLDEIDNLII